jgi:hypothetical protein
MKRTLLFSFALLSMSIGAIQNAHAGAAVAIATDLHDQLATAYGGPVKREKQRALAEAQIQNQSAAFLSPHSGVPGANQ